MTEGAELVQKAESQKAVIEAIKTLASGQNHMPVYIEVAGVRYPMSVNSRIIPLLELEVKEIDNYLQGNASKWRM